MIEEVANGTTSACTLPQQICSTYKLQVHVELYVGHPILPNKETWWLHLQKLLQIQSCLVQHTLNNLLV